jgi:hypothetical protein
LAEKLMSFNSVELAGDMNELCWHLLAWGTAAM